MDSPYKLSYAIFGHSSDVRSIAVTPDNRILSGSRDKTAKLWVPNGTEYSEAATFLGHTNFVSAVCFLPADSERPNGLVVTGSNDNSICVYEPSTATLLYTLKSHTGNVCCLTAAHGGTFLSASWDKTAKHWPTDGSTKPLSTLAGHQAAVWSVIQLASGMFVTGSADKTIKVWSLVGDCLITLERHTDCVRGLAATSPDTFLSVANDATVRRWSATTGACLETLYGHSNYIYSVSTLADSADVVTSGEDWTVRVWRGGECLQTITLPAQSVWSVATLANGDIVAGASDGVIRIFSRHASRHLPAPELAAYDASVAAATASSSGLAGIDVATLPGPEALATPGARDGQTRLVREGGVVVCHAWCEETAEWTRMGEVTGAATGAVGGGKQMYNGREYDYVFSVDIEEGKPPLKLPYNLGEDPWAAAQSFIHANDLSQLFLDQVANFIVENSKRPAPVQPGPDSCGDPLTGGARYIPGGAAAGAPGADPFTGANRYVPAGSTPVQTPSKTSRSSSDVATVPYFPQRSYLRFDQANVSIIQDKLSEFNSKVEVAAQVSAQDIAAVCCLAEVDAAVEPGQVDVLRRLLDWPQEMVFPALDVARLAVRSPACNRALCSSPDLLFPLLRLYLAPDALPANQMLAARIACNMMNQSDGETLALKNLDFLLQSVADIASPKTKNVQIALSTLMVNLSVAIERTGNSLGRSKAVEVALTLLTRLNDSEAQFRALVALGTLIWEAESAADQEKLKSEVRESASGFAVLDKLAGLYVASPSSNEAKATNCAAQVLALMQI